jgi:hypothetical protein
MISTRGEKAMSDATEMTIETVINILAELLHDECHHEESMANGHGRALALAIEWLEELRRPSEEEMAEWSREQAKWEEVNGCGKSYNDDGSPWITASGKASR